MDSTTLTSSISDNNIIFEATVPKNTWFGLGFGKSGAGKMVPADIIFF